MKEIQRLTDKVKEKSLATKIKENVGEIKNQLEDAVKENKRLTVKVQQLEASLATKPIESAKLGEDKWLLEDDRRQLKEERKLWEVEKKTMEQMKKKVEEERVKVEEEKGMLKEERVKVENISKEQEKLVECPVCLTMPREDKAVPCCPQGHFVCTPCRDQSVR